MPVTEKFMILNKDGSELTDWYDSRRAMINDMEGTDIWDALEAEYRQGLENRYDFEPNKFDEEEFLNHVLENFERVAHELGYSIIKK